MTDYKDIGSYTILGIGGKGAYYVAKYLLLKGCEIKGYDLRKSEKTDELESLGIDIVYENPKNGERFDTDGYIYSNDLPQRLQSEIFAANNNVPKFEVGEIYHMILDDYESQKLSDVEIKAFKDSNIAPLYQIDYSKMKYIAVTGTDGKTTTCTMIYHLLKEHGFKPALITTVSAKIGNENIDTGFHTTTPTSQELYSLLQKAEKSNCTHMILETTSHGLSQGRIMGLKFDAIAYTNITEEHLDYHKSWENLAKAKSLLLTRHAKRDCIVGLNIDDSRSYEYLSPLHSHLTYSQLETADLYASEISESEKGIYFKVDSKDFFIPILGKYNISNFLAASIVVKNLENMSMEDIGKYISSFKTITGRMEVIQKDPFFVIVDYAHTPNALENALKSAKEMTKGRLIHVFGCAGHRDYFKRPQMGRISGEIADITILTAEDPRLESLKDINDEIAKGYKGKELIRFDDESMNVKNRRDAIHRAIQIANEGDTVIITGKAHESSLCFGQTEYIWNDIEEVKKLLNV